MPAGKQDRWLLPISRSLKCAGSSLKIAAVVEDRVCAEWRVATFDIEDGGATPDIEQVGAGIARAGRDTLIFSGATPETLFGFSIHERPTVRFENRPPPLQAAVRRAEVVPR